MIHSKIVKIVATRCHLLRLKFTKFHLSWGSAQTGDPAGGGHSALPDPWLNLRGLTSKHGVLREGKGRGVEDRDNKGRKRGQKGEGRREGREGKERSIFVGAQSTLGAER